MPALIPPGMERAPPWWAAKTSSSSLAARSRTPPSVCHLMLSEEVQLELLKVGVIPTLKSCVDSEAVQADPKWSVYMKQLESAQSRIPTPQASTVEQLWQDAMTEIFIAGRGCAVHPHQLRR